MTNTLPTRAFAAVSLSVVYGVLCQPLVAETESRRGMVSKGYKDDWPTVHHDAARSAATEDSPAPPFHRQWVWTGGVLENVDSWAEPIVAGSQVFVGTYAGNLYALDRSTGRMNWKYAAGNLIIGSPAVQNGLVFVGSLGDLAKPGYIHAVDVATGRGKWIFQAPGGFWTSPCLLKGLVLMGGRDGTFYAVDENSGKLRWKFSTPAPILTTAAAKDDMVLIASEEGRAYCLNLPDGSLRWRSNSLLAITVRGYYPMIWGDTALFLTMPACLVQEPALRDHGEDMLGRVIGDEPEGVRTGRWKKKVVPGMPLPAAVERERQAILNWLKEDPSRQTAWALRLSDGKPKFMLPIIWHAGNMGTQNSGCITPDGWFCTTAASYFNNWSAGEAYCPIRVHFSDGRIEVLNWAEKDPRATPGFGNTFEYDEAYNITVGGKRVYFAHQDNLWGLDLNGHVGFTIAGDRDKYGGIYGGFNSPTRAYRTERGGTWLNVDGVKVFSSPNQWHGTGQGAVAVCGRQLFWTTGGMVICLSNESANGEPDLKLDTGTGPAERPDVAVPPVKQSTPADIDRLLTEAMASGTLPAEAEPIAAALNRHVEELLAGGKLMPLVCATGTGRVYAYHHPRDTFRSLALALPYLRADLREKTVTHLRKLTVSESPLQPNYMSLEGVPRLHGNVYDLIKPAAHSETTSCKPYLGLYACWAFCHYGQQKPLAEAWWPKIKSATDEALNSAFRTSEHGSSMSAQKAGLRVVETNELLSALVGGYRLGVMTRHTENAARIRAALAAVVKDRTGCPVADAPALGRSDPVMWYGLTPESARLLARLEGERIRFATNTPGLLTAFVTEKVDFTRKNFWHVAWGEGAQTDEAAMLYPQYPLALFHLRAFVFEDRAADLAHWSDIAWCSGDLCWIEKLTVTLWVYAGRNWETAK